MSENKITKRSDLFREYAKVMDMCEGTNVKAYSCVKYKNVFLDGPPSLFSDCVELNKYEFAIAIVEDRPVFKGDVLWTKDSQQITVESGIIDCKKIWASDGRLFTCEFLSWQEPKRTITINGKEYPAPVKNGNPNNCIVIQCVPYYFENANDFMAVRDALWNLLNGK